MKLDCDVLVVGAGPAGLSAARAASLKGAKVICIDKKKEIGIPVRCAEGIGVYLFNKLPFVIPKKYLSWKINGIIFKHADSTFIGQGSFWQGYSINRTLFETWLCSLAVKAGVKIFLETEFLSISDQSHNKIIVLCKKKHSILYISSKKLIAADGIESNVFKQLDNYNNKKFGVAEVYSFEIKSNFLKEPHFEQIFYDYFAPQGYAYIFPKSRCVANIGVGTFKHKSNYYFSEFINSSSVNPQLKNMKILKDKSYLTSFDNCVKKIALENVMGVGDSVNHNLKPLIEGILPAIICGDIGGQYCVKKLDEAFDDREYRLEINKVLGKEYAVSNTILSKMKRIFSYPPKKCAKFLFLQVKKLSQI